MSCSDELSASEVWDLDLNEHIEQLLFEALIFTVFVV